MYSFMLMLPITEVLKTWTGVYIPLLPVLAVLLCVSIVFSGQLGRFWAVSISKPWMLLLGLMLVAAIFGQYRSASTLFIAEYGARYHVLPFYCCAFIFTTGQVRRCLYWLCGAGLLLLLICLRFGEQAEGRFFVLPGTSLSNPNDLAFTLLLSATILLLLMYAKSIPLRVIGAISIPLIFYFVLKTASRANFVTLVVLLPVAFWVMSRRVKIAILILGPIAAACIIATVPSNALARLVLIWSDPNAHLADDPNFVGAIESQITRTQLQERAAKLALRNPLLGVGAQQFQVAVEKMVREETGRKSGWQEAHNTYLEIAAENGVPALLCFLASLFLTLKMNIFCYRTCRAHRAMRPALGQSVCLLLMTVAYMVGLTFSNSSYDVHLDLLVAFTAANFLAIRQELAALGVPQPLSTPSAAPLMVAPQPVLASPLRSA